MMAKRAYKSIFVIASILLCCFSACTSSQKEQQNNKSDESYTCSMHPEIHEKEPGNCPICGMELVKEVTSQSIEVTSKAVVSSQIKKNQILSKLPTVKMKYGSEKINIESLGIVGYDNRFTKSISAQIEGRIEKMYVKYPFQYIEKGQKIVEIYSPELLTTQQNLLLLLKTDATNISLIESAENKLLLLGMDKKQLNQIEKNNKPMLSIALYSNYSGYAYEQGVINDVKSISLKEGNYVTKGQILFQINDKNKAWIHFDIAPENMSFTKVRTAVKVIPDAFPDKQFDTQIDFIEPFYANNAKTLKARIYFDNKTKQLAIGSQVKVVIETETPKSYWLPKSAVVSLGEKEIVFVKDGDVFTIKEVNIGVKTNEYIQIIDGINIDDDICLDASFLVDNESLIKLN